MKISIIIPIYNSEKYLEKCLDSVLTQSYTDFEVLLINDGSTDSSGVICDAFAKKDNRIHVFHKENEGVSSARNLGIEKAQGNWLTFIDSDDYLEPGYLNVNLSNADLIVEGFCFVNGNHKRKMTFGDEIVAANDYKTLFEEKELFKYGYPFSKFFKKSIIDNNQIKFPETFSFAEDLSFFLKYISASKSIKFADTANYNYISHPNSLSKVFKSPNEYWSRYIDYKEIIKLKFPEVYHHIFGDNLLFKEFTRSVGGALFYYVQSLYMQKSFNHQIRQEYLKKMSVEDMQLLRNFIPHLQNPLNKIAFRMLVAQRLSFADAIFTIFMK